jgi:hypothetical protein
MAADSLSQHSSWVVTVLSGFVIPLALASATLAMLWLDDKRQKRN